MKLSRTLRRWRLLRRRPTRSKPAAQHRESKLWEQLEELGRVRQERAPTGPGVTDLLDPGMTDRLWIEAQARGLVDEKGAAARSAAAIARRRAAASEAVREMKVKATEAETVASTAKDINQAPTQIARTELAGLAIHGSDHTSQQRSAEQTRLESNMAAARLRVLRRRIGGLALAAGLLLLIGYPLARTAELSAAQIAMLAITLLSFGLMIGRAMWVLVRKGREISLSVKERDRRAHTSHREGPDDHHETDPHGPEAATGTRR